MFDLIFLANFSLFSIACIVLGRLWIELSDDSINYPLSMHAYRNPFEIAALRNGRKGVIQTVLFSLWYKNELSIAGRGNAAFIWRKDNDTRVMPLSPIEEAIYNALPTSMPVTAIFVEASFLHEAIDPFLQQIECTLEEAYLKPPDFLCTTTLFMRYMILFLILSVGLTELIAYLYYDQLISLLVIVLTMFTLFTMTVLKPAPTTWLGYRYLKALRQHTMQRLKSKLTIQVDPILAVAVCGVGIFGGLSFYEPFEQAFAGTNSP